MLFILLLIFFIYCSADLLISVNNLVDSSANYDNCIHTNRSNACNFRSAWETCNQQSNNGFCYISFPVSDFIYMDIQSFGGLILHSTSLIILLGNDSTVAPLTSFENIESASLIVYHNVSSTHLVPMLSVNNMTFSGFYNKNNTNGGVINIHGSVKLSIMNATFFNNTAVNGGSIYVSSNLYGTTQIKYSQFQLNHATNFSGSLHFDSTYHIMIQHTNFYRSSAINEAGSMYFLYTMNVTLDDISVIGNCPGNYLSLTCGNLMFRHSKTVTMNSMHFLNTSHSNYGGGINVAAYNDDVQMTNIVMENALAPIGGCLFIDEYNYHIAVTNSSFYHCKSFLYGAGIAIFGNNSYIRIQNVLIDHAITKPYIGVNKLAYGGGIFFVAYNQNIQLINVTIQYAQATAGGGIYMLQHNSDVLIQDSLITSCTSILDGAGINIVDVNTNIRMVNTRIEYSTAMQNGGGIAFGNQNSNISLQGVSIISNAAKYGGGVYISQKNEQFTFKSVSILNNSASGDGGGLYFDENNIDMLVYESRLKFNCAQGLGGGIYYNAENIGATIVASKIVANLANFGGGGIYMKDNNPQFAILDQETFQQLSIMESPHPYKSEATSPRYVIYEKIVHFSAVCDVTLIFDSQTTINSAVDTLYIYSNNAQTQLVFQSTTNSDFPGTTLPPLIVSTDTISLIFYGPDNEFVIPTLLTSNFYGFKVYITPVVPHPLTPTYIERNYVQSGHGGGISIFSYLSFPVIANTFIRGNIAAGGSSKGGGLYLRNAINGMAMVSVIIQDNNSTGSGAGVCFATANYGIVITKCQFVKNHGLEDGVGGGISFLMGNGEGNFMSGNAIIIEMSLIHGNTVVSGGFGGAGLYSQSQNTINIKQCSFFRNQILYDDNFGSDSGSGGGLYLDDTSIISITNCNISQNSAENSGGGLFAQNYVELTITETSFDGNSALQMGGGMFLQTDVLITLSGTIVCQHNIADIGGGGIALSETFPWNYDLTYSMLLFNNTAERGSAIFIYAIQSHRSFLVQMTLDYNTAWTGGTVFWVYDNEWNNFEPGNIGDSSNTWGMHNVALYGNKTATQGINLIGPSEYHVTVYNQPLTPPIAYYLLDYYGQFIPLVEEVTTVAVSLMEHNASCFGVHAYLSGANTVGAGVVIDQKGYAIFDQLQAVCSPNGNVTIQSTALLGIKLGESIASKIPSSFYIQNTTVLRFRSCQPGEYNQNGICTICPKGSYSLVSDSLTCTECAQTTGISQCYANQIQLQKGYWRRYDYTSAVLKCPGGGISCQASNFTGDSICKVGYEGPLCAVCSDGYYRYNTVQCNECQGSSLFSPTLIAVLLITSFFLVWVIYWYHSAYFIIDTHNYSTSSIFMVLYTVCLSIYQWWLEQKKIMTVRIKILVSTFQIVSVTSTVFAVTLPVNLNGFFNSFKFFNLNISSMFPIGCTNRLDFIETMFIMTICPIVLVFLLFITFGLEYEMSKYFAFQKKLIIDRDQLYIILKNKYLNYIFYISYLVLPSVTTTLFQTFLCTNIDPNSESVNDDSTSSYYLTADMSISCTSDYYYEGITYAIIMIIVYPVGIPFMYLYLLYQNHQEIMERDEPLVDVGGSGAIMIDTKANQEDSSMIELQTFKSYHNTSVGADEVEPAAVINSDFIEDTMKNNDMKFVLVQPASVSELTSPSVVEDHVNESANNNPSYLNLTETLLMSSSGRQLSSSSSRIGFLWQSYAPKYWYWEIVDTTRRLMLTAVISVCFPGTAKQSIIAIFLTTIYCGVYNYCQPYANPTSNTLAELGLAQIFYTFFGMMIFQNELLTDDDQGKLGGVLVVINLTLVGMIVWYLWIDYKRLKNNKKQSTNSIWNLCLAVLWPARAAQPTTTTTTIPLSVTQESNTTATTTTTHNIDRTENVSSLDETMNIMYSSSLTDHFVNEKSLKRGSKNDDKV